MTTFSCFHGTLIRKALALAAFFALAATAQAQQKIATIDLQQVFTNYFKTKQADSILQEHAAEFDKTIKGWIEDYGKQNDDYKKLIEGANDQAVSADEREKRKKGAESKIVELRETEKSITQLRKEAEVRIKEQQTRMREKILGELRDAIDAKAKLRGYSFVFDISGWSANNGTHFLLYSSGQDDLTTEIIAELNANAPRGVLTSGSKEEKPVVSQPKTDEKPVEPVKPAAKPKKK